MEKQNNNPVTLTDKAFSRLIISSILAIIVCIFALCGATFAWFTSSTTSENNNIKSGIFELDVSITDETLTDVTVTKFSDGIQSCTLGANGTYTVTLDVSDTATVSRGHCIVTIETTDYKTESIYLADDRSLSFTIVTADRDVSVSFDAVWGSPNISDVYEGDVIDLRP